MSNTDINAIQKEFNLQKNIQVNNNFNNAYPLQDQKSYALDNLGYQNQNVILNQREIDLLKNQIISI